MSCIYKVIKKDAYVDFKHNCYGDEWFIIKKEEEKEKPKLKFTAEMKNQIMIVINNMLEDTIPITSENISEYFKQGAEDIRQMKTDITRSNYAALTNTLLLFNNIISHIPDILQELCDENILER